MRPHKEEQTITRWVRLAPARLNPLVEFPEIVQIRFHVLRQILALPFQKE
ncbi:hypothetical protein M1437_00965 [Patescibacteria group bacterium]|nr:hypothetical protein [Patescibacteria group bacterium]